MELIKIVVNEEVAAKYPRCVKVTGEAPKQFGVTNLGAIPEPEDFDESLIALEDEEDLPEGTEVDATLTPADDTEAAAPGDDLETADDELIDEDGAQETDEF